MVVCSKEAPWGIHRSLSDDRCPRCGFLAPRPYEETMWWRTHGPKSAFLLEDRRPRFAA